MAKAYVKLDEDGMAQLAAIADIECVRPITEAVADDMRLYVPVLTGALRSTIDTEYPIPMLGLVRVGNNDDVLYALYVEYGTSKMDAQPYARPALYKERVL